jgi:hypothetical protein
MRVTTLSPQEAGAGRPRVQDRRRLAEQSPHVHFAHRRAATIADAARSPRKIACTYRRRSSSTVCGYIAGPPNAPLGLRGDVTTRTMGSWAVETNLPRCRRGAHPPPPIARPGACVSRALSPGARRSGDLGLSRRQRPSTTPQPSQRWAVVWGRTSASTLCAWVNHRDPKVRGAIVEPHGTFGPLSPASAGASRQRWNSSSIAWSRLPGAGASSRITS